MTFHIHTIGPFVLIDLQPSQAYTAQETRAIADALHEAARQVEEAERRGTQTTEGFK